MEIAENKFAYINNFVYIGYACGGGGGAGCSAPIEVSGRILSFDYANRKIIIEPILSGNVTIDFIRENGIDITKDNYIISGGDRITHGMKYPSIVFLRNAIIELLNMSLINNIPRCNELKPKINKLFETIDDPTLR